MLGITNRKLGRQWIALLLRFRLYITEIIKNRIQSNESSRGVCGLILARYIEFLILIGSRNVSYFLR